MTIRGHRTRRAELNGIFNSIPVKNGLKTLVFSADDYCWQLQYSYNTVLIVGTYSYSCIHIYIMCYVSWLMRCEV
jgi:hypothetical protein